MKRVFEIAEMRRSSMIFLVQRYGKCKNQVKGCSVELRVSDCRRMRGPYGLVILSDLQIITTAAIRDFRIICKFVHARLQRCR